MKIELLRRLAGREEIDYPFLMSAVKDYSGPREKISHWLKSGDLIRVKKGLYVFGKDIAQVPYSLEIMANLIYGPSAISLNYALSYYGLIPERVSLITSITNKRHKEFSTPIGQFNYYYLNPKKYAVGIVLETLSSGRKFLIASPEKAICDIIYLTDHKILFNNLQEIESYLVEDLRIEKTSLQHLNRRKIAEISAIYQDRRVSMLNQLLKSDKKHA